MNDTYSPNLYALFKNSSSFKPINLDDIDAINYRYNLKYQVDAIKAQYNNILNNCDDINNYSIVTIGYNKNVKDKCVNCCKCTCNSHICKKNNCKFNVDYNCPCVCNCYNKIISQFAITETFKHGETSNTAAIRAINEEININIKNTPIIINDNLYGYKSNYYSGNIHNAFIHVNETTEFEYINTKNSVTLQDDKSNKMNVVIYGKTDLLKNKFESVFKNVNGFTSDEQKIMSVLIIPVCYIHKLFRYVNSSHTSIGSYVHKNITPVKKSFNKSTNKNLLKLNNNNNNIIMTNMWSILDEI